MAGVSASVNLPLHHKVQKFSSGTGSLGWSRKKGYKTVVVWWWFGQKKGHLTCKKSVYLIPNVLSQNKWRKKSKANSGSGA